MKCKICKILLVQLMYRQNKTKETGEKDKTSRPRPNCKQLEKRIVYKATGTDIRTGTWYQELV